MQNAQIAVSPTDGSVYVSWRRFKYQTQDDAVMVVKSIDGGVNFSKVLRIAGVRPFDQGTTPTSFRTNGFQTMAIDGTGRVYLAWPDRGYAAVRPDPVTGDSRIVISTSANGSTWTVPRPVQTDGLGHQLMPALTLPRRQAAAAVLRPARRRVAAVRAVHRRAADPERADAADPPHHRRVRRAGAAGQRAGLHHRARVRLRARLLPGSTVEERLQFNPPEPAAVPAGRRPVHGRLHRPGAGAAVRAERRRAPGSTTSRPSGSAVSHAFWTDNRDVRAAGRRQLGELHAGDLRRGRDARAATTRRRPSRRACPARSACATRTSTRRASPTACSCRRPATARRSTASSARSSSSPRTRPRSCKTYRLRIENQPIGGQASFLQFGPALTTLDVTTPVLSSVARTVFVTSQDEDARDPRVADRGRRRRAARSSPAA